MPPRKGFFIRLLAALIDATILLIGLMAVSFALITFNDNEYPSERLISAVAAGILLAYSSFDILTAGTPGKRLLGLTIAYPDATPAPRVVLSLRWSTKYFPVICALLFALTNFVPFRLLCGFSSLFVIVGCLYASCDHRQSWHDQWSRTAVFRRRDLDRRSVATP